MKKFLCVALAFIVMAVSLAGCAALTEKAIIGTWTSQTTVLGVVAETEYTFNEDGTGSLSTGGLGIGIAMNYTINEDKLTITTNTLGVQITTEYTFELDGDSLILTDKDGSVTTLTKE